MVGLGLGMEREFSDVAKRTCFNLKGDLKTKNSSTHEVRKGENKKNKKHILQHNCLVQVCARWWEGDGLRYILGDGRCCAPAESESSGLSTTEATNSMGKFYNSVQKIMSSRPVPW